MKFTWLGGVAVLWLLIMIVRGYSRGLIKEIVSLVIMFFSLVLVWMVQPYVSDFLKENTTMYERIQETTQELVQTTIEESNLLNGDYGKNLVDQLPLPEILKEKIEEENKEAVYQYLNVRDFSEYVAGSLAMIIINGISFLVSFILVHLVLRIIAAALDLISKLPVLNGINRLAGACIGGVKGVAVIWILLLLLTIFCSSEYGNAGMKMVADDSFLSFLYEKDVFIKMFMNIFHGNA